MHSSSDVQEAVSGTVSPSRGSFLTCRGKNIFYFVNKICMINYCMCDICKYLMYGQPSYLEWYISLVYISANFRPHWLYAQSQLSIFRPLTQPLLSPFPPFPPTHASVMTQTTSTYPSYLLLWTLIISWENSWLFKKILIKCHSKFMPFEWNYVTDVKELKNWFIFED